MKKHTKTNKTISTFSAFEINKAEAIIGGDKKKKIYYEEDEDFMDVYDEIYVPR